ncbi:MAG TPA: DUF4838 domain-containing protein [Vicinamibacterales bacterium]|nr:DUF4838 domain-containing protein [Vicinamibacterales bacterium]
MVLPPGALWTAQELLRSDVEVNLASRTRDMKAKEMLLGLLLLCTVVLGAGQALAAPPSAPGECVITVGGVALEPESYAIVIPDGPTAQEQHAAGDLADHLEQMTGKRLAVVAEKDLGRRTPIAVGKCTETLKALGVEVDFDALGLEGIAVETKGPALVLAGNRRGVLYAVYSFLEDHCDCRWFTPDCSRVPRQGRFDVSDLQVRYVPPLEYRSTDYPCSRDADWAVRNKINGTQTALDEKRGGKIAYSHSVHTFNSILDPAEHFKDHPEWFSKVKGKRQDGQTQLCLTNPEVLEIAKKTVRQWIQEAPAATVFSVSQNDWRHYCECPACKALAEKEGSQAGPLIHFVNAIADDIAKDYPDKVISTLAYQYTRKPPREVKPRPNVCVRLCSIECCFAHPLDVCETNQSFVDDIRGWNRLCNRLYIWDYVIDYSHSVMPFPNLRVLRPNIRFFISHGVKGVYEEACYFTPASELAELRTWIMAKTLWNPDYDTDWAIDEFLGGYYGPAAGPLRQYLDLMHRQVVEHRDWHVNIWAPPTAPYLGREVVAEAVRLFDEAAAAVKAEPVLAQRVAIARLPVLYVQIMTAQPGDARAAAWLETFEAVARQARLSTVREHGGTGRLDVWLAAQRQRLKAEAR